jgi:hypothetical protein
LIVEVVAAFVILMPLIALDPVAAEALRLPTRLLTTVTALDAVVLATRMPLTVVTVFVPPIS